MLPEGQRSHYVKLLAFAVITILPWFLLTESPYFSTLVLAAIFASVAVSVDLLLGFAGQLALGQTAVFAVGAYTTGVLTTEAGVAPELALVAALAGALVLALVTSPMLRLRGFYFALATLALVLVTEEVLTNWIDVTGGASGLVGIAPFEIFGLALGDQASSYLFAWVVLMLAVTAVVHIRHSRFGRALVAIRDDETAAEALGISVFAMKVRVWLVAAGIAGLAGVIYAHYIRFLSPAQFGLEPTIYLLAAVVVGGTGSVYGAAIGVAVIWMLPEVFSQFEDLAVLALGVAVILFMIFAPEGLVGRFTRATASLRTRGSG